MKKKSLKRLTVNKTIVANVHGGNSQQGNALPINTVNACNNPQPIHTQGCYTNQICPMDPVSTPLEPIPVDPSDASDCFCYP